MTNYLPKLLLILFFGAFFAHSAADSEKAEAKKVIKPEVRVNLLGYAPQASKRAVVIGDVDTLRLLNSSGDEKGRYVPTGKYLWKPGMDSTQLVDFSDLTEETRVAFYHKKKRLSLFFNIRPNALKRMANASLKAFYYNRASTEITDEHGGKWRRKAGHPDTVVKFHKSSGETGTHYSPKGWYDAGDYGKYIVNSGISTYTLQMLYEDYTALFDSLNLKIPESQNKMPDLLDEIKYNLDWMLTMQAQDGGVWHKLTTLRFNGSEMPNEDNMERYIIGKGTAASFDFAFVMAQASRVYKKWDPEFAKQCLEQAVKAFQWALDNPNKFYRQPSDVQTGAYSDYTFSDEKMVAAIEMYRATKEVKYIEHIDPKGLTDATPSWQDVAELGLWSIMSSLKDSIYPPEVIDWATTKTIVHADSLLDLAEVSGHWNSMISKDFKWGSNSGAANQGIMMLKAFRLTGEKKYLVGAQSQLDYLLGVNPFNKTYVTGYGEKSPMSPHHRPSEADKIGDPVPGFLVGGPHMGGQDTGNQSWHCKDYVTVDAKSWVDWQCSYATNEVTINWNAPLAYLTFGVQEGWKSLQ